MLAGGNLVDKQGLNGLITARADCIHFLVSALSAIIPPSLPFRHFRDPLR